jgi:hypothetical protein
MAQQTINIGQSANDKNGDALRTAFAKVNANFTELYATASADVQIPTQTGNGGKYLTTSGTTLSWSNPNKLVNGSYNFTLGVDGTVNFDPSTNGKGVLQTTADLQFTANTATLKIGTNGKLTLPDGTIQGTAFKDVASNVFYVDPSRSSGTYTRTGTFDSPYNTVTTAISAAVTAGYVDGNPAEVILMGNTTENITLAPGVYLTSLGTGTHGSPNITGTVTVTSSTGTTVSNHYSISNLRIIAPTNGYCINFTGTAPQKLFVRDMWLDANGTGAGIYMDNTGSGSTLQMDTAHLAHSGTGDVYCINVTKGGCYVTDIETSGAVQVAAVQAGATLTIDSSELDANGDIVAETYSTGQLTITNSVINQVKANATGIKMNSAGGVVTLGNNLITVPAGTGYAVQGVSSTFLFAANNVFTANTARSTAITYTALSTTWTTKT